MRRSALTGLRLGRREDAVSLLKSLWQETPQPCPLCGGPLTGEQTVALAQAIFQATNCTVSASALRSVTPRE